MAICLYLLIPHVINDICEIKFPPIATHKTFLRAIKSTVLLEN